MTEKALFLSVVKSLRGAAGEPNVAGQAILVGGEGRVCAVRLGEVRQGAIPDCGGAKLNGAASHHDYYEGPKSCIPRGHFAIHKHLPLLNLSFCPRAVPC